MKKIIGILLVLIITSCGGSNTEQAIVEEPIVQTIDQSLNNDKKIGTHEPGKVADTNTPKIKESATIIKKETIALDKVFNEYKSLDLNKQDIDDVTTTLRRLIEVKTSEDIMNTSDHSECLKLVDPDMEEACIINVVQQEVFKTEDITACNKLYVTHKISRCKNAYFSYKAITGKDTSFCDKIIEKELRVGLQSECRDQLIIETVKETKDITLCKNVTTPVLNNICNSID